MVQFRPETAALLLQRYCFLTPDAALKKASDVREDCQAEALLYLTRCKWAMVLLYAVSALSLLPLFSKTEMSWLSPPMLAVDGISVVLCAVWFFFRQKALASLKPAVTRPCEVSS